MDKNTTYIPPTIRERFMDQLILNSGEFNQRTYQTNEKFQENIENLLRWPRGSDLPETSKFKTLEEVRQQWESDFAEVVGWAIERQQKLMEWLDEQLTISEESEVKKIE
jgi:hypothetical protein